MLEATIAKLTSLPSVSPHTQPSTTTGAVELAKRDVHLPTITIAILVRNSDSFLPTYLWSLTRQDYPKSLISIYIRTNDNRDRTLEILDRFVNDYRGSYARMLLNSSDVDWSALGMSPPSKKGNGRKASVDAVNGSRGDSFDANQQLNFEGKWNERKLRLMGLLRQQTLDQAWAWNTDCFFVADADNFIISSTLRALASLRLPMVSPMLTLPDINHTSFLWTSHHMDYGRDPVTHRLYFQPHRLDGDLRWRRIRGIIQVPLVQCTFLLWLDPSLKDQVTYLAPQPPPHPMSDIKPGEFEFQVLAESLRRAGVKMYVDNTHRWGYAVYHNEHLRTMKSQVLALEDIYERESKAPFARYWR